jgi:hypothetical protein
VPVFLCFLLNNCPHLNALTDSELAYIYNSDIFTKLKVCHIELCEGLPIVNSLKSITKSCQYLLDLSTKETCRCQIIIQIYEEYFCQNLEIKK